MDESPRPKSSFTILRYAGAAILALLGVSCFAMTPWARRPLVIVLTGVLFVDMAVLVILAERQGLPMRIAAIAFLSSLVALVLVAALVP